MAEEANFPTLYVIAGPNGSGKTTFARTFLPKYADCLPFVNADLIALGLSPFAPEAAALRAGRLVLEQIEDLSRKRVDFAIETTLSGKLYAPLFRRLKANGYLIYLFFLWLPQVETAVARIADRVRHGGHHIPEEDARRRYARGLRNFVEVYQPLLDGWILFDNTGGTPVRIAETMKGSLEVRDAGLYSRFLDGARTNE